MSDEFDTNKVLDMMTSIREGRNFHSIFDGKVGSHQLLITGDGFQIRAEGDGTVCNHANTARELGIALLMWANANESTSFSSDQMFELTKLLGWVKTKPEHHTINKTRAEWYERNIPFMTLETMKRNWTDLRHLERANNDKLSAELSDIRRSMDYLWHAMGELQFDIDWCRKCGFIDDDPHFCK